LKMATANVNQQITKADQVFKNGFVYTVDEANSIAEAVAIKGGIIVFVGNNEDVSAFIGADTKVTDLDGKMLMPSLFEAHGHAQGMAKNMFSVNLKGKETLEEYVEAVKGFLAEDPGAKFIAGLGWSNKVFPPSGPRKEDLDAISKDIPIAIWSEDIHSLWVNSKALAIAQITEDTVNPAAGIIERSEAGEPSGTLREGAAGRVMDALPDFTVEQYKIAIKAYQEMANFLGFTGCFDPLLFEGGNPIKAYKELAQEGELTMVFRGAYGASPELGTEQIDRFAAARTKDSVGDLFQMTTVKFFADGVIEGATAYLSEPYAAGAERPEGFTGEPIWAPEQLNETIAKAEKAGFQIHCHCIGDAATHEILDAIEFANKQNGKQNCRHAITHLQLVDPADIQRFAKLGVVGVANPYWFGKEDYFYDLQIPYLGEERANREYPFGSFLKAGVVMATASDYPVTDPLNSFFGIQCGITRTVPEEVIPFTCEDSENPKYREPLWPEERATVEEMLKSFTVSGAYANFLENETGSIKEGKYADLIVVDQNILKIPKDKIGNTKVLLTLLRGKEVFRASGKPSGILNR